MSYSADDSRERGHRNQSTGVYRQRKAQAAAGAAPSGNMGAGRIGMHVTDDCGE